MHNCRINRSEELRMGEGEAGEAGEEMYFPVHCTECSTELGVYSAADETYHIFNVFPSNAL